MVSIPRCGCHGKPARYCSGRSLRKSSSSRNGSNSVVSPKPKARRRCTPAPSRVGLDDAMRLTGRIDMVAPRRGSLIRNLLGLLGYRCFPNKWAKTLGGQEGTQVMPARSFRIVAALCARMRAAMPLRRHVVEFGVVEHETPLRRGAGDVAVAVAPTDVAPRIDVARIELLGGAVVHPANIENQERVSRLQFGCGHAVQ